MNQTLHVKQTLGVRTWTTIIIIAFSRDRRHNVNAHDDNIISKASKILCYIK